MYLRGRARAVPQPPTAAERIALNHAAAVDACASFVKTAIGREKRGRDGADRTYWDAYETLPQGRVAAAPLVRVLPMHAAADGPTAGRQRPCPLEHYSDHFAVRSTIELS